MAYTKPTVVAQNGNAGSYAAGCPAQDRWGASGTNNPYCADCERAQ